MQYGISGAGLPDMDASTLWRARGWNVGIFYWNELADDDISSTERKIQDAGGAMHWLRRGADGSTEACEAPQGTGCVAAQLAAALEPLWMASCCRGGGEEASQLRLVGHSLGAQLVIAAARRLLANCPPHCMRRESSPRSHADTQQTHPVAAGAQPGSKGCAESLREGCLVSMSEQEPRHAACMVDGGDATPSESVAPLRIALLDPFCSTGGKEWLDGATPQQRADESLEALCRALPSTVVECYRTSVLGDPPLASLSGLWGERCELLHQRAAFTYVSPAQAHPWDVRSRHIAAVSLYFLSIAAEPRDEEVSPSVPGECRRPQDRYQQPWHGAMHPGAPDEFIRDMMRREPLRNPGGKLSDRSPCHSATGTSICSSIGPFSITR